MEQGDRRLILDRGSPLRPTIHGTDAAQKVGGEIISRRRTDALDHQ